MLSEAIRRMTDSVTLCGKHLHDFEKEILRYAKPPLRMTCRIFTPCVPLNGEANARRQASLEGGLVGDKIFVILQAGMPERNSRLRMTGQNEMLANLTAHARWH